MLDLVLRGHLHDEDVTLRGGPDGGTLDLAAGATYANGPWHQGALLGELVGSDAAGDLGPLEGRVHFLAYAADRGFWHRDGSRYRRSPDGRWTFPLPARLGAHVAGTRPGGSGGSVPSPSRAEAVQTRCRLTAATIHAPMSFYGMGDRSKHASGATVQELFTPLAFVPAGSGRELEGEAKDEAPPPRPNLVPPEDTGALVHLLNAVRLSSPPHEVLAAPALVVLGDPGSRKSTLAAYLATWAAGGLEVPGITRERGDVGRRDSAIGDLLGRLDLDARVRELARNPLLATLICLVHGHRATLPGERARLYDEVVELLLVDWLEAATVSRRPFDGFDADRQRRYLG